MSTPTKPKVVLAYSGGLDTSVILKWLCEKGFEVIAFCSDVGQHHEDFEAVKAKAVSCGAIKCVVTDQRADFVENYIFEAIKCNAIYEGRYLLGTSVARPCIAKEMVRIANEEGAGYVAHGATGKGNDQVRFEMCAQALDARIKTIAPWRDAEFIESFKAAKIYWHTAPSTAFQWMPNLNRTILSMRTYFILVMKVVSSRMRDAHMRRVCLR